jgi:hypothetical protein
MRKSVPRGRRDDHRQHHPSTCSLLGSVAESDAARKALWIEAGATKVPAAQAGPGARWQEATGTSPEISTGDVTR